MNFQQRYYSKKHEYLNYSDSSYIRYIASEMINFCDLNRSRNILEIGCGAGRFTIALLNQGIKLTVMDSSEEMLNKLRNSIPPDAKIKIIHSDVEKIQEYTDEKFDTVIGFHILHHIPDIENSLKIIRKILKPDGKAAFLEPNPLNPFYYSSFILYKDHTWAGEKGVLNLTKRKLRNFFKSSGFNSPDINKFGLLPPMLYNNKIIRPVENVFNKAPFLKPVAAYLLIQAKVIPVCSQKQNDAA